MKERPARAGRVSPRATVESRREEDDALEGWPEPARRRVPAPAGWEAIELGDRHASRFGYQGRGAGLWLERTWRSPREKVLHLGLGIVALLVVALGVAAVGAGDWEGRVATWLPLSGPGAVRTTAPSLSSVGVVCVFFGSLGFYISLARALNRTRIEVKEGALVVRHAPIPWRGVRRLARADVEQIHCTESPRFHTFSVHVTPRGGREPLLICEDLPTWKEALFVERRVERALGIVDRKVEGEMLQKRLTS